MIIAIPEEVMDGGDAIGKDTKYYLITNGRIGWWVSADYVALKKEDLGDFLPGWHSHNLNSKQIRLLKRVYPELYL